MKWNASINCTGTDEGSLTRPAQADLERIHAYVSKENPAEASRLVARLIERARALGDTPLEGRATDEQNARVIVVAQLRHFIFYIIVGDEVHITHIRHPSRRRPAGWIR
jgi:plasmid stabilization system protein ParE